MKKTASHAPSLQQLLNLAGFIASVLSEILSSNRIQYWLAHKTELRKKILELFSIPMDTYTDIRREWEQFYLSTMKLIVDFSTVRIPEKPSDGRKYILLFIAAGITQNQIYDLWKFPKGKKYDDLDKVISCHARNTSISYAVWILDSLEIDIETLGKSTRQADPLSFDNLQKSIGITTIEKMILELKYFNDTGMIFNSKGVIFCSGSRFSDDNNGVPYFYIFDNNNGIGIGWYHVDDMSPNGGICKVIA